MNDIFYIKKNFLDNDDLFNLLYVFVQMIPSHENGLKRFVPAGYVPFRLQRYKHI